MSGVFRMLGTFLLNSFTVGLVAWAILNDPMAALTIGLLGTLVTFGVGMAIGLVLWIFDRMDLVDRWLG